MHKSLKRTIPAIEQHGEITVTLTRRGLAEGDMPASHFVSVFVFDQKEPGLWLAHSRQKGLELPTTFVEKPETPVQSAARVVASDLGIEIAEEPTSIGFEKISFASRKSRAEDIILPNICTHFIIAEASIRRSVSNAEEYMAPVRLPLSKTAPRQSIMDLFVKARSQKRLHQWIQSKKNEGSVEWFVLQNITNNLTEIPTL